MISGSRLGRLARIGKSVREGLSLIIVIVSPSGSVPSLRGRQLFLCKPTARADGKIFLPDFRIIRQVGPM